jgi:hypothetical protein
MFICIGWIWISFVVGIFIRHYLGRSIQSATNVEKFDCYGLGDGVRAKPKGSGYV